MRIFGGGDNSSDATRGKPRVARHSSGWDALRKYLHEQDALRILDLGATSATNVNLLTAMGHSIYMADVVSDAQQPKWKRVAEDGSADFDVDEFVSENLNFGGRHFDVVLYWDTSDFIPAAVRDRLIERLLECVMDGGKLLAFSHIRLEGNYCRYHLRDDANVDVQAVSDLPVQHTFTNRQIEQHFARFGSNRFFLAKDNLREILVTR